MPKPFHVKEKVEIFAYSKTKKKDTCLPRRKGSLALVVFQEVFFFKVPAVMVRWRLRGSYTVSK